MNLDEFMRKQRAGARGAESAPAPAPAAQPVKDGHLDIDALRRMYGPTTPTQTAPQVTIPSVTRSPAAPSVKAPAVTAPEPARHLQPAMIEAPKTGVRMAVEDLLDAAKGATGSLFGKKPEDQKTPQPEPAAETQARESAPESPAAPAAELRAERQAPQGQQDQQPTLGDEITDVLKRPFRSMGFGNQQTQGQQQTANPAAVAALNADIGAHQEGAHAFAERERIAAETEAERQARLAEERAAATRRVIGTEQGKYYEGALTDARQRAAQAVADVESLEGRYPFLARGENPVNEVEQRAYDEYQEALARRTQELEELHKTQESYNAVQASNPTVAPDAKEQLYQAEAERDRASAQLQDAQRSGASKDKIKELEDTLDQAEQAYQLAAYRAGEETRTPWQQAVDAFLNADRRAVTGGKTNTLALIQGFNKKGWWQFASSFWSFADMLLGEPAQDVHDFGTMAVNEAIHTLKTLGADLDYLDQSDNLIHRAKNISAANLEQANNYFAANASTSRAAQIVDSVGTTTVAALPYAMMTLATWGAQLAGVIPTAAEPTTASLMYTSALQEASTMDAVGMTAAKGFASMLKNPHYWTAYIMSGGEGYEDAKRDGMSDMEAMVYSLINASMNAMIEIGGADESLGGIQNLSAMLGDIESRHGKRGVLDFLWRIIKQSGHQEAMEEVEQGAIARSLKSWLGQSVPIYSFKPDESRAIFNPWTATREYGGGFTAGMLLGAPQASIMYAGESGSQQTAQETTTEAETKTETETETETKAEPETAPEAETAPTETETAPKADAESETVRGEEEAAPEAETPAQEESVADRVNDLLDEARRAGAASETNADADIIALLTGEITPEEFASRQNPGDASESSVSDVSTAETEGDVVTPTTEETARTDESERLNPAPVQTEAQGVTETPNEETAPTVRTEETTPAETAGPDVAETALTTREDAGIVPPEALTEPGEEPAPGMRRSQTESNSLSGVAERLGGEQNPLYYMPVTERQTLTAAVNRVMADGVGEMERLAGKEHWTAEDVDTAMTIYGKLQADGVRSRDFSAAQSWGKIIQARGTGTAQALQAFSKWTRSGSGQASAISEQLEGAVADYEESGGRRGVSPEEADRIRNDVYDFAHEFDSMAEDDIDGVRSLIRRMSDYRRTGTFFAKNFDRLLNSINDVDYLREFALRQMSAIANDATAQADIGQKLKTLQVNAMLLRVSTFLRNIGGNALFGTQDVMTQDGLGVALDWLVSRATGRREVGFDKGWFSAKARQAAVDAMHKSALEVAGDVDMSGGESRYGTSTNRTFKRNGTPVERFLSRWEQLLGYSLRTSDAFFRGKLEANQREALDNIDSGLNAEEKAELGETMADYRLFQNKGTAYGVSRGLHDILNLIGVGGEVDAAHPSRGRQGGFGLGDPLLPFPGVPANLGVKALEYSPANIVKGAAELVKLFRDVKMANVKTGQQQQAVMDIARGMAGVPIIAALAAAFKTGVVRNSDDEDDYYEKAQDKAEGKTGVQINLDAWARALNGDPVEWRDGDSLMSIGWLEQLNAFMAIASLIAQDEDGDATVGSFAKKYYTGALQSILEMPVMQSVSDIVDATRNVTSDNIGEKMTDAAISFAGDAATGFIPAPISSLAKALDPYQRDTRADTAGGEVLNQLIAAVPWLRETLDVRTDGYGEPESKPDSAVTRALNELFLPGRVSQISQTDASAAMKELHEATGERTAPNRKAPNSVKISGENIRLSTDEKKAWEAAYGQTYADIIGQMAGGESWESMSDDDKLAAAKAAREFAEDAAKRQLAEAHGLEYSSKWDEIAGLSDVPGYLAAKEMFKAAQKAGNYEAMYAAIDRVAELGEDVREKLREDLDRSGNMPGLEAAEAAREAGIDLETWSRVRETYNDILNLDDMTATEKAEELRYELDKDESLTPEARDFFANEFGYYANARADTDRYDALVEAGMSPDAAKATVDLMHSLEPDEDHSSVTQAQRVAAIIGSELSDEDKITAIREYATDGYAEKMQAALDAGVSLEKWGEIHERFDAIGDEDMTATERATRFASILDQDKELTDEQRDVLRDQLVYFSMNAADATRYDSLTAEGMDPKQAEELYFDMSELQPEVGRSSVSQDQRAAYIIGSDMSDEEKLAALRVYTSDTYMEDLQTAMDAGISMELWEQARSQYSRIGDRELSASEKATQFAAALDRIGGLTDAQRDVLKDSLKYYSMVPAEATKYDALRDAGLSVSDSERVVRTIKNLEPEAGKSSVSQDQRVDAILGLGLSEDDTWTALETYASESWVTTARAAVDAGIPLNEYVWNSNRADANGNGSLAQGELWDFYKASPINETYVRVMWDVLGFKTDFETYASKHGGL